MDRRTPKYSPSYFLAHKELRKADATFSTKTGPDGKQTVVPFMEEYMKYPLSVKESNDTALIRMIGKKQEPINLEFGSGATEWLINNMNQFEAEDRLRLYYLFDSLKYPPPPPRPTKEELLRKFERRSEVGSRG